MGAGGPQRQLADQDHGREERRDWPGPRRQPAQATVGQAPQTAAHHEGQEQEQPGRLRRTTQRQPVEELVVRGRDEQGRDGEGEKQRDHR